MSDSGGASGRSPRADAADPLSPDPTRFSVRRSGGRLTLDGVDLAELASDLGTPTYVYAIRQVCARYRAFRGAFTGVPLTVAYAVKANGHQAILSALAAMGAGADVVSGGELTRALAAGVPPSRIVFSGVGKTDAELDLALGSEVGAIHLESAGELARLDARAAALGRTARVGLRVNPDIVVDTHASLKTGERTSKFGIAFAEIGEVSRSLAMRPRLTLAGLSCHIGSQLTTADRHIAAADRLLESIPSLRAAGHPVDYVDLGGGMGIPYRPTEPDFDLGTLAAALAPRVRGAAVELVLEPGRFIVGNAGVLLTRVVDRKRRAGRWFVVVDAGYTDLARPALYGAHHMIVPCRWPSPTDPCVTLDVAGPICDSSDFLARGRRLHLPAVGDVLAILSAGAYGMSMASTFCARPLPCEVMVRDGEARVIRPRQTVDDLHRTEAVPNWSTSEPGPGNPPHGAPAENQK